MLLLSVLVAVHNGEDIFALFAIINIDFAVKQQQEFACRSRGGLTEDEYNRYCNLSGSNILYLYISIRTLYGFGLFIVGMWNRCTVDNRR